MAWLKNKNVYMTARIIFGLMLIIFGLNYFLQFMPAPEFNEAAGQFLGALFATGYIFPIMGIIMLLVGIALLVNKFVPFAMVLFAPFTINIILFHIFLEIKGWIFALIFLIFHAYFIYVNFDKYKPMLRM